MMRRHPWMALFWLLSSTIAACGGGDDTTPTGTRSGTSGTGGSTIGTGGTGGGAPAPLSVSWSPCNLFTEGPTYAAECAEVEAPIRWQDPSAGTLKLFVKRAAAKGQRRGSLWLLDGGPGAGGIGPEGIAYAVAQADSGLDIYIPHHRGTGQSTKLTCPGADPTSAQGLAITAKEWPACIDALEAQWGDNLGAFNVTEAARDVAGLIDAVKQPGDQVFVLGSSYGTYLANRYLRLFPDQASGVILDSICPPDACHLDQFDVLYDQVGAAFLAQCGADPTCSSHVGSDPRKTLQDLDAALDGGHCPGLAALGIDRPNLRTLLGAMLDDWNLRLGIAPVIYRVQRCDDADVAAVGHLWGAVFGKPDDPPSAFLKAWSFPLSNNITFSELWTDPPPPASAVVAAAEATLVSQGVTLGSADVFPLWPRYPRDAFFGAWGDNDRPMLMMNGDLDPATPITIAAAAGQHFQGAHQTFVTLPRSPHGTLSGSPIAPDGHTCGMQLLLSFVADPQAPLDTSCKDQVLPLHFNGASWLAQKIFGTDDMWENPAP